MLPEVGCLSRGRPDQRDIKFASLKRLARGCAARGLSLDQFYFDYLHTAGPQVYRNPYWSDPCRYDPGDVFQELCQRGFGEIPEAALNVFWQRVTGS